jgi:dTDP-4-dehydrorhamnose 3,5-epimerase
MASHYSEPLPGVFLRELKKFEDSRGWLIETFRDDELPESFRPTMGYISMTLPGIARGPHEHEHQTDGFAFLFGKFRLTLWENRASMPDGKFEYEVGTERPIFITVPPGIVHAYQNIGSEPAYVLNFPDKLYAGWGRAEPVDEIRHEDVSESRFKL